METALVGTKARKGRFRWRRLHVGAADALRTPGASRNIDATWVSRAAS